MDTTEWMQVKEVISEEDYIEVITTGCRYVFDKKQDLGVLECYQMLNQERLLARIYFDFSFRDLTVDTYNESRCLAFLQPYRQSDHYMRITINRDSSLIMDNAFAYKLRMEGEFSPRYQAIHSGHMILADEIGGIALYPERGLVNYELTDGTSEHWKALYDLMIYGIMYLSVFPPREFNMEQYFKDQIYIRWYRHHAETAMTYPYPSDQEINEAAAFVNTVLLFPLMWKGRLTGNGKLISREADNYTDASYSMSWFDPTDPEKLQYTISKMHSVGLKVILYASPYYNQLRKDEFLEKVKYLIEHHNLDGIYFDGLPASISEAHDIVVKSREILGDKLLFIHNTCSPVMMSTSVMCPFIDTYADFLITAEHIKTFTDSYLRYRVSSYNISNAIAHICHWGYDPDFVENLIDKAIKYKARFYLDSVGNKSERERIVKENYYPKLKEDKLKYESSE